MPGRAAGLSSRRPTIRSILRTRDARAPRPAPLPPALALSPRHTRSSQAGYIAILPCLCWGADAGLAPSVLLPNGTQFDSYAYIDNTRVGHYGEMASWQMRGTFF